MTSPDNRWKTNRKRLHTRAEELAALSLLNAAYPTVCAKRQEVSAALTKSRSQSPHSDEEGRLHDSAQCTYPCNPWTPRRQLVRHSSLLPRGLPQRWRAELT